MIDIFKEEDKGMVIALDNISKANLSNMANQVVFNCIDYGNEDPLEAYIKAKGLAEIADGIMAGLKDHAIKEAYKFEKDQKLMGCTVVVKSTPTTYDYSHNEEWVALSNEIAKLTEKRKEIEKAMVQAMNYAEVIDADGVVVEPAVVKKAGGETIQITIPK